MKWIRSLLADECPAVNSLEYLGQYWLGCQGKIKGAMHCIYCQCPSFKVFSFWLLLVLFVNLLHFFPLGAGNNGHFFVNHKGTGPVISPWTRTHCSVFPPQHSTGEFASLSLMLLLSPFISLSVSISLSTSRSLYISFRFSLTLCPTVFHFFHLFRSWRFLTLYDEVLWHHLGQGGKCVKGLLWRAGVSNYTCMHALFDLSEHKLL